MNHPAGTIIDQPVRSLVVWCPDWPVVAAGITPDIPAAVFHANRVVAASAAARAEGVTVDLRRREAQGRSPQLLVLDRDEAMEASAFEAVAQAIESFTPRLEILCPGTVATGTRGPSRYFGGDEALAGKVVDAVNGVLEERGTCAVGIADGTFAALQAARQAGAFAAPPLAPVVPSNSGGSASGGDQDPANFVQVVAPGVTPQFLAPLPTGCLERPELVDVWGRLGLRTLGAVAALSLADVVGRFGAEGAVAHRLASGLDERPPDLRDPPPDLVVGTELDPPVERVDQVAFVAKVLADQLTEQLDRRGMACTRLAVEAETDHGEQLVRLWRHDGALSAGAIADRVRWQLDGWLSGSVGGPGEQGGGSTEAWARRPTGPVRRLVLRPDEVGPATGRQLGFWGGDAAADERVIRTLARVQGLLGADAVKVPERRGGRHPAEQLRLVPAYAVDLTESRAAAVTDDQGVPWPGRLPGPAPAVVHGAPVPVEVLDDQGRPVEVSGRGLASAPPAQIRIDGGPLRAVTAWAGPWPAEERWWDPERHRRRARFQLVDDTGAAHLAVREGGGWSVEASYG
mgnify:FL=1